MNRLQGWLVFLALFFILSCQAAQTGDVTVLSMKKLIDTKVASHKMCHDFLLSKSDVVNYFKQATQVDGVKFNAQAMILPCKYTGALTMNGKQFKWEIMAGGAGYLFNKTINNRYLCKGKCCQVIKGLC